MKLRRPLLFVGLALLAGCEPIELIGNPDVDSWCGDVPCGWEVKGRIERVSTWHSHDYAVSLASDHAELAYLNDDPDAQVSCIGFSLLAKVAPQAHAYLELDFLDDGEVDWQKRIPTSDFDPVTFYVRAPAWYSSVRFIVRKDGPGEVVLARLRATASGADCDGPEIELHELPGGGPCDQDEDCKAGSCIGGFCAGCSGDQDCDEAQTCGYLQVGYLWESRNVVPACVSPAARPDGALCLGDRECTSGICCEGVCSPCCGSVGCGAGASCRSTVSDDAGSAEGATVLGPHLCSAGLSLRATGSACTVDEDCMSRRCRLLSCTGLCSGYGEITDDCAKLDCDQASCEGAACEVETIPLGICQ